MNNLDETTANNDDTLEQELENTVLRLSDYLATVQLVVKETFRHSVWVKAELRNVSSKNGHYYFELAEKDDAGKVVASCRGNLWRFKAERVLRKFERATGMSLTKDVTVLLNVNATMHPLYGFSLTVNDIDPSYTLGDLARQYAAMLEQLSSEGLLELNKQLPQPFDIEHVLVISPEKAAGLGDFKADADRLASTGACHFHYHHATFQSNTAPKEIRHAITKGMLSFKKEYARLPDVIVIIRGGGAVGDLAYLNDYELAALVAEQSIPVWVGIGHERDNVILDEVAHTSFDTPSKVISAISDHLLRLMQRTQQFADSIKRLSRQQLATASRSSELSFQTIQSQSQRGLQQWQHLTVTHFNNIKQQAQFQVREISSNSERFVDTIYRQSHQQLNVAQSQVERQYHAIQSASTRQLEDSRSKVAHFRQLILVQHPARLLSQGYALVKNNQGTYVNSIETIEKGDFIDLTLQDGSLSAVVTHIEVSNHQPTGNDANNI